MKYLLILIICVSISGCASKKLNQKYTSENIKKFTQVALVEPTTSVYEVGRDVEKKDDQTNRLINLEFKSLTAEFISKTNSSYYGNDSTGASDYDSLFSILNEAFSGNVSQIKIGGRENILGKIKEEKIILNYVKGFHKTKSLVRSEMGKSFWIALVTLGMYMPIYHKYGLDFYSVMIDKKSGEVIYRENVFIPMDPREVKTIEYVVNQSISKYFDFK